MEEIYPRLKDFCRDYMLEFQVVDMRWGVRDEATNEHKTADLCMTELNACQRLSLGPNFVVNTEDNFSRYFKLNGFPQYCSSLDFFGPKVWL